jgi:NAD(P)H-hydrate epimerase
MGHALLVAGSAGMAGAAVLASRACMRSGVGKCTVCTPRSNNDIMQISVPEVIVSAYDDLATPAERSAVVTLCSAEDCRTQRQDEENTEEWKLDFGAYDAVGIGPGLGQSQSSEQLLRMVMHGASSPMVVDADAINLIGKGVVPIDELPEGLIFTPHKKEFERLLGAFREEGGPCGEPQGTVAADVVAVDVVVADTVAIDVVAADTVAGMQNDGSRMVASQMDDVMRAMAFAIEVKGYVLLKGHRSALCCHDGEVIYNTTGNAGMATAGSGDVLTGIITGLLARGYEPKTAAMMGMYLHGLAGDLAAEEVGQESLIASDIIKWLPQAIRKLYSDADLTCKQ